MSVKDQNVLDALSHVRAALIAAKHGAPVKPALLCAEEKLLRALFSAQDVEEYLGSSAAQIYGRGDS